MFTLISALIELVWWPYEAWKHSAESSRMGVSPDKEKTLRFWYVFAMTVTVVILLAALAFYWLEG